MEWLIFLFLSLVAAFFHFIKVKLLFAIMIPWGTVLILPIVVAIGVMACKYNGQDTKSQEVDENAYTPSRLERHL